jgi:hypothetical protein
MKAILCLILAVAAAAPGRAAAPAPVPEHEADSASRYDLIGEDYKKAAVLPDTVFNPFKIQAAELPGGNKRDTVGATNESILAAVEHHRVSGVLLATDTASNRVIIGDEVFGVGDTLEFFEPDKGEAVPLVMGANVVLREIKRDSLALDVGLEGETPHRIDFLLRSFWRP